MDAQDKELKQLHNRIVSDVEGIVSKYMSIIGLDVPENDEDKAEKKIIAIIRETLIRIEDKE